MKAQGMGEAEPDVVFDQVKEEEREDDETMAVEIDGGSTEMHVSSAAAEKLNEGESLGVKIFASPIDE